VGARRRGAGPPRRVLLRLALTASALIAVAAVAAALVLWLYAGRLGSVVAEGLSGRRWAFPSRVYSDGFLVYPGLNLEAAGLFARLHRLGYRETGAGPLQRGDFRRGPDDVELFPRDFERADRPRPERPVRIELNRGVVRRIVDADSGQEILSLEIEPEVIAGLFESTWEARREVSLAEIPPRLVHAILITEDRRFFSHHGVDPTGILRAMFTNVRHGGVVQGGSTLTQQLMKNFFLSEERTWRRKLKEAAMALVAERQYSKNEILDYYLNEIYLGQNGLQGIFGVWEAAEFYFARPPLRLTLGETAMLAGLIRAPNYYSPYRNPDRARRRRATVLGLMREAGIITASEQAAALQEPLRSEPPQEKGNAAPYFVDFLRHELAAVYPPQVLTSEGLAIFTTLDMQLQAAAGEAVEEGLSDLEARFPSLRGSGGARVQACLIAVRPQTGEIKAMVGGRDYGSSQFNRAVAARRQPGSVFKPFVYLAAFEAATHSSDPVTPASRLLDEPFEWVYDSRTWRPSNYRQQYLGSVTVRQALEMSLNSATARLAQQVGLEPIRELAARLGIEHELPRYPSIVLGAIETSPLEIAQAYATLANQGFRAALRSSKEVVDREGQPLERRRLEVERVASPAATYLVTHILEGVLDRGTGRAARDLGFQRPAAGKTGTTNDSRDAWFAGFTPDLLTVVWVGFDEDRKLGLTGASAALPIWTKFMLRATAARPETSFLPPQGVRLVRIDPRTGGLATSACPQTIEEAFLEGQEPTTPCPLHSGYASLVAPAGGDVTGGEP
jgi:penicillin-binding protein 1B